MKEEKQSMASKKRHSIFIARGFLSGKRRNNSLYKIQKFYKYLLILKYPPESITEPVTGAHLSLGTSSTERNLIACIDFEKDERYQDFVKDFAKGTKRFQLAILPAPQSQGKAWRLSYGETLLRNSDSQSGGNLPASFVSELHPSAKS